MATDRQYAYVVVGRLIEMYSEDQWNVAAFETEEAALQHRELIGDYHARLLEIEDSLAQNRAAWECPYGLLKYVWSRDVCFEVERLPLVRHVDELMEVHQVNGGTEWLGYLTDLEKSDA